MDAVVFRPARAGDGPACARLWTEFGRAMHERRPGFREPPGEEERAVWFDDAFARDAPDALRIVGELDGVVVAFAWAVIRRPEIPAFVALRDDAQDVRVMLEDIVVTEDLRSQRIGERLVRAVEAWARDNGATTMMLNSDPDGAPRRFYERIGYEIAAALYMRRL